MIEPSAPKAEIIEPLIPQAEVVEAIAVKDATNILPVTDPSASFYNAGRSSRGNSRLRGRADVSRFPDESGYCRNFGGRHRNSIFCFGYTMLCILSINGFFSLLCINGVGSILSVNSIMSFGSLNSVLSIGSVNSILSYRCVNSFLSKCQ